MRNPTLGAMVPLLRRLAVVPLICCVLAVTPAAHAAGDTLALRVRTSSVAAQVQDTIRYSLTVENTAHTTIRTVTVKNHVDDDLDVVSVPIIDRVAAAGLSSSLGVEEIFWTITRLRPGQKVTVYYNATVIRFGDGRLENVARVIGSDGSTAEITTSTYVLGRGCPFGRLAGGLT